MKTTINLIVSLLLATTTLSTHAVVLKFATLAPDGTEWMKRMRAAGQEIAQRTDNRVKLKFYPGGVMGDDKTVLRKMRIGQLHGGTFTSAALSNFYSDSQVYNLPLKFRSFAEVDYVRTRMDKEIISGYEQAGILALALSETGFAYTMSQQPIDKVADLSPRKVWIPSDDQMGLVAIRAFDVDPIPLAIGDVLTGLQTGLIDTVASSPIAAIALQWHNQIHYVTDLPLIYIYQVLAMDKKAYKRIPAADQATVREVMVRVATEIEEQTRRDNIAAYEALRTQGLNFRLPSNSDLKIWQTKAATSVQHLLEQKVISQPILERLNRYLEEFRKEQALE